MPGSTLKVWLDWKVGASRESVGGQPEDAKGLLPEEERKRR